MDERLFARKLLAASGEGVEIRSFTDERIDAAIRKALAGIGPDTRAVTLDVDFDGEGVRGVFAGRIDEHWSVGLIGEIKKGRGFVGGARVRYEF